MWSSTSLICIKWIYKVLLDRSIESLKKGIGEDPQRNSFLCLLMIWYIESVKLGPNELMKETCESITISENVGFFSIKYENYSLEYPH